MLIHRSGSTFKSIAASLLERIDVRIGGSRPWDIQIHNESFYQKVLRKGSLGLGESYAEGWWDAARLDEFFVRLLQGKLDAAIPDRWAALLRFPKSVFLNRQSRRKAAENSMQHYDRGLPVYQAMLDSRMIYSCAYWKHETTLEKAQEAKLRLVCEKLELRPKMKVLDIGCGWGGFCRFAAETYGVHVTGITVSPQQFEFAREICKDLPVEIGLMDYRQLAGTYDRIVSIGMFEHVGPRNYRTLMKTAQRCLNHEGLFLLQTIGGNESTEFIDPWIDKYIFPGAVLPSVKQIGAAIEGLMVMEDWHGFGPYYDRTLMAWFENFDRSWPKLRFHYDESFYRIWKYYLLSCAATFRVRNNQLWQIVFSNRRPGAYIRSG